MSQKKLIIEANKVLTCCPVISQSVSFVLAKVAIDNPGKNILHIVSDDNSLNTLADELKFFLPHKKIILIPAWDSLPYDRVSPSRGSTNVRIKALYDLISTNQNVIVITSINSLIQRTILPELLIETSLVIKTGATLDRDKLIDLLIKHGFFRVSVTNEPGEFSVRGSIIDIAVPGEDMGVRLDFFGAQLESIKNFDLLTQKSGNVLDQITLLPVSEVILGKEQINNFSKNYLKLFGVNHADPLYESVVSGQRYAGVEHWLPLFYDKLATLFDYVDFDIVICNRNIDIDYSTRFDLIQEYYNARNESAKNNIINKITYNAISPDLLWINKEELNNKLSLGSLVKFDQFLHAVDENILTLPITKIPNFLLQSKQEEKLIYDILKLFIKEKAKAKLKIIIGCVSEGSRQRIAHILLNNDIITCNIAAWNDIASLDVNVVGLAIYPIVQGFETEGLILISEQDILGERVASSRNSRRKLENIINETISFAAGEFVVHRDYGIGQFIGLETVNVLGIKHDFLSIEYDGGDKLYIPVENIEILSRYSTENEVVQLNKLGGTAWQLRKARLQNRIKIAAEELLKTAAARELKTVPIFTPIDNLYEEFCAKFPYAETDDQLSAIKDIEEDLSSGRPMDRLVCGDVGFGKTEVALRAAFIVALTSADVKSQVAVIVPSTLLSRQHYHTFKERFSGFPVRIALLSRMVTTKEAEKIRQDLATGNIDIIIGTHALLNKYINFHNLQLLIIDEEHHFGVTQKEKLKQLCADVHILALSATPVPRTLQMSLVGIKKLSLIATTPIDRMSVRTFIMPLDYVIIKEAILREYNRGGKIFYVCPRIADLAEISELLKELVPEIKIITAHGQIAANKIDEIMTEFCGDTYDILLSTSIVESGLDIAKANTIIVHRADMFGLAQLYQLRGRVGRGKIRAYAYLTLPSKKKLSQMALRRLEIMQTLDSLGAGFSLASHDMDLRGFGNLVGEEQSGYIKEVGVELYQDMLKEAIKALIHENKEQDTDKAAINHNTINLNSWVPQINSGLSVLIPESYIPDLPLRLGIYRRAATLMDNKEIEEFALELIDRFGQLPKEVENLLTVIKLKQLCYQLNIDKIDLGPQAVVIGFKDNICANPEKLLVFIKQNQIKLRADHKLVLPLQALDAIARLDNLTKKLQNLLKTFS